MNIAIIGTGNVGGALAQGLNRAGHRIRLGVRDLEHFKGKDLLKVAPEITVHPVREAVESSDVIILAAPAQVADQVARQLGDVAGKIIIDTMNGVFMRPEGFANTTDAILANCNTPDVVKCFNSTGFETMFDPRYGDLAADMFVAGDSVRGKAVASGLARDLGFGEVWDFGGLDKVSLLEQFALSWINLAILQKHGRGMAFKILRR
ncbi:MAG: NAD(P)-binding domain-containing protein [Thermoanaerobaculia bacterium]|nr:NAD(P)-binding domain-containing protein [Thermoanaerobaculia bacterium]